MPSPDHPINVLDRDAVGRRLDRVRERTLSLVSGLDWEILRKQHISILSPMIWDLGHIANFEEQWLCQHLGGISELQAEYAAMFDPVVNPRPTRKDLPLPIADQLLAYMADVRATSLGVLESITVESNPEHLDKGLLYELVAQHEEQHQETLLQALQILDSPPYSPMGRRQPPKGRQIDQSMVRVPEGPFRMGDDGSGFAYDNERPTHVCDLPEFQIDITPVTCGAFERFIAEDGYKRQELWSDEGWSWCTESGVQAPANWLSEDGIWKSRWMNIVEPLAVDLPVTHVCYWEAEAFCEWAGKRLPSEAEWEKAALWDFDKEESRPFPWGDEPPAAHHANLDQLAFGPAPVGAFPAGVSAYGAEQMVGDVWEWTRSDFMPYPGFRAFPYKEYSEVFFGQAYKVLRGGSWATRPAVARGTFRNWDFPIRRQIFAGFRGVKEVD